MSEPLTQDDLDEVCDLNDCSDHEVRARCHGKAQMVVTYNRDDGVLTITCGVCGKLVLEVEVAP